MVAMPKNIGANLRPKVLNPRIEVNNSKTSIVRGG